MSFSRLLGRRWLANLLLAAAIGFSSPAAAAKKKRSERVVALFLSAKGKPNAKLYAAFFDELNKTAKKERGIRLLHGAALKKVLKKKPDPLIAGCGADIACISKLGRSADAERVLAARVSPAGGSVKVQIVIVDVGSRSRVANLEQELTSTDNVAQWVAAQAGNLFGDESSEKVEEIPLDLVLEEIPPPVVSQPNAAPPAGGELPLELAFAAPPPAEEISSAASGPSTDGGNSFLSASSGGDEGRPGFNVAPSPPPSTSPSRWLTYVGLGVAGLGAAALGTGGYFGVQSNSTRDSIDRSQTGDTQIEGQRKRDDAYALADRANLMFGIGGGLIALGASLIVVDLLLLDSSGPSPILSVGTDSAALGLAWGF